MKITITKTFGDWPITIHEESAQQSRILRGKNLKTYRIDLVSPGKYQVYDTKYPDAIHFDVTLNSCSCPDFEKRQLPCKHIYYLAIMTGNFMTLKQINDDLDRTTTHCSAWRESVYDPEAAKFIKKYPPMYRSASGGYTNFAYYRVTGVHSPTGKKRDYDIKAITQGLSEQEAESRFNLLPPYSTEILPASKPTEKQIQFAAQIGFSVSDGWSLKDMSAMLSRCEYGDFIPLDHNLAWFATVKGCLFSSYSMNEELIRSLFFNCENDVAQRAELYLVVYCLFHNLPSSVFKNSDYMKKYVDMVLSTQPLINSLKRKSCDDYCYPLSNRTNIYKATSEFLETTLGIKKPIKAAATQRNTAQSDDLGCLLAALGIFTLMIKGMFR